MPFLEFIGEKVGMTRMWSEQGVHVPLSVVKVVNNTVIDKKNAARDGYDAIVVAYKNRKNFRNQNISKIVRQKLSTPDTDFWQGITEMHVDDLTQFEVGTKLSLESLAEDTFVDVSGVSKGKGFAGVIKRYNFKMQDATHGNSLAHRAPGSIGQCQTPGRVWKGKKMAGHMGSETVSIQNLKIYKVNAEEGLVFIKGAIPGAPGGIVRIKPAVKNGVRA